MARPVTISKLQTGNADLDRVQEHLREKLNPVLASLPSAADFRWMQVNGVDQTVADTWALQFRTTGTTWTTITTFTSAGQIVQSAWIAPTYTNAWVNFGSTSLNGAYMKDSIGFIRLRGTIKNGTIGLSAFTLPSGFRPNGDARFAVTSNGAYGQIDITASSGAVTPSVGSNLSVSLDGISFDTRS